MEFKNDSERLKIFENESHKKVDDGIENCSDVYDEKNTFEFTDGIITQHSIHSLVNLILTIVHKYFVFLDIIMFEIVQNLTTLPVLMIIAMCKVDVAMVNRIVHMMKMNMDAHSHIIISNLITVHALEI